MKTSHFSPAKRFCLSASAWQPRACSSASVCASFCCWTVTYQGFVLDLLPDELVFTQGVAGLSSDGVDGPLFHLLLDGAVQHEQRLPGTLLRTQAHESHTRAQRQNKALIRLKALMHYHVFKLEMLIIRRNGWTCACTHEHLRTPACAACWTNLEEFVKEEGEPVCEHLLSNRLCSETTENKSETIMFSLLSNTNVPKQKFFIIHESVEET